MRLRYKLTASSHHERHAVVWAASSTGVTHYTPEKKANCTLKKDIPQTALPELSARGIGGVSTAAEFAQRFWNFMNFRAPAS